MAIEKFKKYVAHHLLLGIFMIIESIFLILRGHEIIGIIYLIIGLILFIDDLLAETKDISIMKKLPERIQEPNTLKSIGIVIFIIQLLLFILLMTVIPPL